MVIATAKYVIPIGQGGWFQDSTLANVEVLRVIREGIGYNKVSDGFSATDPVNREYCYLAADGKIYFSDVSIAQTEPQNIFIIYKT
jgi:hypothetical protein